MSVIKNMFSPKVVIIALIIIQSLLLINYSPRLFGSGSLLRMLADKELARTVFSIMMVFKYVFEIALMFVLYKFVSQGFNGFFKGDGDK